ncbi:MAG: hypothetical protein JWP87_1630 [Labilithrix sp.]|nr:hypothetical protein [Labilithrix sp.]
MLGSAFGGLGANAFGVDGAGIGSAIAIAIGAGIGIGIGIGIDIGACAIGGGAGASIAGAIIGALGIGAGAATESEGASGMDAGIGSGDETLRNDAPPTTAIGAGVRSGLSGAVVTSALRSSGSAIGSVLGVLAALPNRGGGADGAAGGIDGVDRGADGATDAGGGGTDGARGAIPPRGTIEPDLGRIAGSASDMRAVAGATLTGPVGGALAAGATPAIVFLRCERAEATGRGSRDALSAPLFRSSDPNAAPMRKLK